MKKYCKLNKEVIIFQVEIKIVNTKSKKEKKKHKAINNNNVTR